MFVGVKFSKTKTGVTDVILSRGFPQSARDTQVWNYYYLFFEQKKLSLIHYFHIHHNVTCFTPPLKKNKTKQTCKTIVLDFSCDTL